MYNENRIMAKMKSNQAKRTPARQKETDIQKIVSHYFKTKGLEIDQLKKDAKKKKIIYARYTRPAKELLALAGSVQEAKKAITKIAKWAKSRGLDYAIETTVKKWLELDKLKPKKAIKKPFYDGKPMIWSKSRRKWYIIDQDDEWKEFAGQEEEIEWKRIK